MADALEALIDAIAERVLIKIGPVESNHIVLSQRVDELYTKLEDINPANVQEVDYAKLAQELTLYDLAQELDKQEVANAIDLDEKIEAHLDRNLDDKVTKAVSEIISQRVSCHLEVN